MNETDQTPCQHPTTKQRSLYARGPRTKGSPYVLDAHRCICGVLLDNVQRDRSEPEPQSTEAASAPAPVEPGSVQAASFPGA